MFVLGAKKAIAAPTPVERPAINVSANAIRKRSMGKKGSARGAPASREKAAGMCYHLAKTKEQEG